MDEEVIRADDKLHTTDEVAERLRVKPGTVSEWCRLKKIKARKIGKLWRIPESALQKFLQESEEKQLQEKKRGRPMNLYREENPDTSDGFDEDDIHIKEIDWSPLG